MEKTIHYIHKSFEANPKDETAKIFYKEVTGEDYKSK